LSLAISEGDGAAEVLAMGAGALPASAAWSLADMLGASAGVGAGATDTGAATGVSPATAASRIARTAVICRISHGRAANTATAAAAASANHSAA